MSLYSLYTGIQPPSVCQHFHFFPGGRSQWQDPCCLIIKWKLAISVVFLGINVFEILSTKMLINQSSIFDMNFVRIAEDVIFSCKKTQKELRRSAANDNLFKLFFLHPFLASKIYNNTIKNKSDIG